MRLERVTMPAPTIIRWRAKSGLSLARAGLGREPDQFFSGPRRRGDRRREDDPPRLSFKDNVAALGVDAGHAPGPRRGARKGRGINLESIGMIPVHVLDDARLALNEGLGASKRQEKVARAKIEDASEAADVVGALNR